MNIVVAALYLSLGFATSAVAQDSTTALAATAACGPRNIRFNVKEDPAKHPTPQLDPDKAVVYVIQDLGEFVCVGCAITTRVGMDGAWVGANHGSSYFFFTTTPGEHHLCANWQSRFGTRNRSFAMANFTAEAGRVYYFRIRLLLSRSIYYFELEAINSDQGKYLVASSPLSTSHPPK